MRLLENNMDLIVDDFDLIIDGSDNIKTRFLLNDYCYDIKITLITTAISYKGLSLFVHSNLTYFLVIDVYILILKILITHKIVMNRALLEL